MWICFISARGKRRSVPLNVDAGRSIFPQWRFCVDLRSAHGTSLFSIEPHGNTILTKYMLKSKLSLFNEKYVNKGRYKYYLCTQ